MKIGKILTLFGLGGSAYVGLELMYRGRSHISMFGAGGLCFLLLGQLRGRRVPGAVKVGAGAGVITAVELATIVAGEVSSIFLPLAALRCTPVSSTNALRVPEPSSRLTKPISLSGSKPRLHPVEIMAAARAANARLVCFILIVPFMCRIF